MITNIGTCNTEEWQNKMVEINTELEQMNVSIAVKTKIKKKGQGMERIVNYIYIFSEEPKDQSAIKGVSILLDRKLKNKVTSI